MRKGELKVKKEGGKRFLRVYRTCSFSGGVRLAPATSYSVTKVAVNRSEGIEAS
jgi:hypothetical protein